MTGTSIIQPPVDAVAPAGWATATLIAVCIIDVALLIWAAYDWRRRRSPILLVCLIGGVVSNLVEAPLDTLLMYYFPTHGQVIAYTTFDRTIPLWATLCYPILFGVMAYVFFRVFETQRTRAQFWKIVLVGFAINIALEFSIPATHIYTYYGEQPFRVLNFPLYWGAGLLWTALAGIVTVAMGLFLFDLAARVSCADGSWRIERRATTKEHTPAAVPTPS